MTWLIVGVAWVACGGVQSGLHYAYFQREWPRLADKDRSRDTAIAVVTALCGPISLFVTVSSLPIKHGWLFPGSRP